MKLGIITNYNRRTVNFGNVLQTYALNFYLRSTYPKWDVETVNLHDDFNIGRVKTSYVVAIFRKLVSLFTNNKAKESVPNAERIEKICHFADDHIQLSDEIFSVDDLAAKKYDVLVVGSDVVWSQERNNYNIVKFLCYKGSEKAVKFSYAASFGKNYIPIENRHKIKKALSRFKGISVREISSVGLLKSIGVHGVTHVCDPTLLLDRIKWADNLRKPERVSGEYILCFLLNPNEWQMEFVNDLKVQTGHGCVFVTNGYDEDRLDRGKETGDIVMDAIGPDEWLWLVANAKAVITDSFHCMIFSNIFHRDFLVLKRDYNVDINNRMLDFLKITDNNDKFISRDDIAKVRFDTLHWEYNSIDEKTQILINQSKAFVDYMMNDIG